MPRRPPVFQPPGLPAARDRARNATERHRPLYSRKRHRAIREALLRDEPFCRICRSQGRLSPATIRDHIVALQDGGADTRDNSQPLCTTCHNRKTAAERIARRGRT